MLNAPSRVRSLCGISRCEDQKGIEVIKTSVVIAWAFVWVASVSAQCRTVDVNKIELRGLRLEMPLDTVRRMFPYDGTQGAKLDEPPTYAGTRMGSIIIPDPEVNGIEVRFLDNRLFYVRVVYSYQVQFSSIEQFAAKVSRSLKLTRISWSRREFPGRASAMVMRCPTFELNAIIRPQRVGPELELYSPQARKTEAARYAALEEKRRSTFKP